MQFLIFTRNNIKKILIITIIFFGLSILFGYLYDSIAANYYNYQFPKDYVYVSDASQVDNQGYLIDNFDYRLEEEITYKNQRGIDLQEIEFIRATSNRLKNYVSEQLRYNHLAISQQYTQMADGAVLNQNNINVKMSTYDIDYLTYGRFPENHKEMLVSELFALDILKQNNLKGYDQLLGLNFEGNQIVGVYQPQYLTEIDEIIIYGTDVTRDKAALLTAKQFKDIQDTNNIEYVTAKDFQVFNWALLMITIYLLATILISTYLLKSEIEFGLRVMRCASINNRIVIINLIMPVLIITICALIAISVMVWIPIFG